VDVVASCEFRVIVAALEPTPINASNGTSHAVAPSLIHVLGIHLKCTIRTLSIIEEREHAVSRFYCLCMYHSPRYRKEMLCGRGQRPLSEGSELLRMLRRLKAMNVYTSPVRNHVRQQSDFAYDQGYRADRKKEEVLRIRGVPS